MSVLRGSETAELAVALRNKFAIKTAIETGTHKGEGTLWLAENFDDVITIDINPQFQEDAKDLCKSSNATFMVGDSRQLLPLAVESLTGPALFWLDSHNTHEAYGPGPDDCPLLEELTTIFDSPFKHFILVDDLNAFLPEAERKHQPSGPLDPTIWPHYNAIKLKAELAGYDMFSNMKADVFVIAPPEAIDITSHFGEVVYEAPWQDEPHKPDVVLTIESLNDIKVDSYFEGIDDAKMILEEKLPSIQYIYDHELTRYTSKWDHYFELYDQYFSKFRGKKPVVIEIGVDNGGSLEMWKKYFGPDSMIIGIDNRPKVTEIEGCSIVFGDQGNEQFWINFVSACPHIDVVIDDGSHYMAHQILTFEKLFPHMNEGGIYFCEDTHSSYWNDKLGNPPSAWGGGLLFDHTFIEYCKKIVDALHEDYIPKESPDFAYIRPFINKYRSVKGIHFYDSVVVVEKALRKKAVVTYANKERAY